MSFSFSNLFSSSELSLGEKIFNIRWGFICLISLVASVGFLALYSAAGGNLEPWAAKQIVRFSFGITGLVFISLIDIRAWHALAYWIYGLTFLLLIVVEIKGHIGMGAQRWIALGPIQLQPSEIMKVSLVLVLARFFNGASLDDVKKPLFLLIPLLLIAAPAGFVLIQPDLGTAIMLVLAGGALFFLAGVSYWIFGVLIAGGAACVPVAWHFLHDYQKKRVLTFLNPENDPLGAGYHITQSKIALGSGGLSGKGLLQGTQSHLNFLPEKQTDFIFTLLAEEWGLSGGILLLMLFGCVFLYGGLIAMRSYNQFGRLLAFGLTINFSLYVFINIAMVTGLIPVVGVPLPLISYGGTAMMALLFGFGLIMSVYVHKDIKMGRKP